MSEHLSHIPDETDYAIADDSVRQLNEAIEGHLAAGEDYVRNRLHDGSDGPATSHFVIAENDSPDNPSGYILMQAAYGAEHGDAATYDLEMFARPLGKTGMERTVHIVTDPRTDKLLLAETYYDATDPHNAFQPSDDDLTKLTDVIYQAKAKPRPPERH